MPAAHEVIRDPDVPYFRDVANNFPVQGSGGEGYRWGCKCGTDPEKGGCIQCDGPKCDAWFHNACVNLTDVQAEHIHLWYCKNCVESGFAITYKGVDYSDDEDPGEKFYATHSSGSARKTAATKRSGARPQDQGGKMPSPLTMTNLARINAFNAAHIANAAIPAIAHTVIDLTSTTQASEGGQQDQGQDREITPTPSEQLRLWANSNAEMARWTREANEPMSMPDGTNRHTIPESEGGIPRDGTPFSEPPFPPFASDSVRFGIRH